MKKDDDQGKSHISPYNSFVDISAINNSAQMDSPPKQSGFSPRSIMNFFSKNLEDVSSPRDFMQNIQSNFRSQANSWKSKYTEQEISNQFGAYIDQINQPMQIHKAELKKAFFDSGENDYKQQIQNEVKLNKISKEYFYNWNESGLQQSQHNEQTKLGLLMLPLTADSQSTSLRKIKISMRQKQEELTEHLDEVQLIIFNKAKKYSNGYIFYINNISSADQQIENALYLVHACQNIIRDRIKMITNKHSNIIHLLAKQQQLQETLKLMGYMKKCQYLREREKNIKKIEKQTKQESNHKLQVKAAVQNKNSPIHQIICIHQFVANIQETEARIKANRLKAIKKQLEEIVKAILTTYNREDWLRSELPKHIVKEEIQRRVGITTKEHDFMNNSFLNVSVLDQSYCMGAIKSGSTSEIKMGNIKKIAGFEERKRNLREQWVSYYVQYYGNLDNQLDVYLQQEQQVLGELVLKQLLKHNSSFNRDIQDYLTLVYAQKNLIQQAQTHAQRLEYLQAKFYNKILALYYDGLKSLIKYVHTNFPELRGTQQKLMEFLKQRIQQFINFRKINYSTQLEQIVYFIQGTFDYWMTDSLLSDQDEHTPESKQALWESYLSGKKVKLIEDYINNLHENTLVSRIKKEIQDERFEIMSIPSEYFLTLDFILNWGQVEPVQEEDKKLELQTSLSLLGDLEKPTPKSRFSIFKVIDKILIVGGQRFRVIKSFFVFAQQVEIYLKVKCNFPELTKKVDEKICEIVGFYSWYNKKNVCLKNKKTLKSLLIFYQLCQLLLQIINILKIETVPKKTDKLSSDFKSILSDIKKEINMFSFILVEEQISKIYQSRIGQKKEVPTVESMKIIGVLEKTRTCIQQFQVSPKECLENAVKVICKNYFGYLVNMETRGKMQLKWFIPKLRELLGDLFDQEVLGLQKKLLLGRV